MPKRKEPWITFNEVAMSLDRKTKVWLILTKDDQPLCIGGVRWHSGWRRYVFHPEPNTIWEQDCLRTVAEFIEQQTTAHKEALKARKS